MFNRSKPYTLKQCRDYYLESCTWVGFFGDSYGCPCFLSRVFCPCFLPSKNFGWIMVGGEDGGFSAHRFSSRENSNTDQRPKLTLIYQSADELFRDGFEATLDCP